MVSPTPATPAYLLDSSVCVMILRGRTAVAELPAPPEAAISAIVAAELWAGAVKPKRASEAAGLEQLRDFFPVIDFTQSVARFYGEIRADLERRVQPIDPVDLLIAAHARSLGATVVTVNVREFKHVKGLKVQAWK